MENPYDFNIRENTKPNVNINIFDFAYYKGNLYSYFGILPELILLVPAKLVTGQYMNIETATFIFFVISSIFTVKLFSEIIYRYYKKIPFLIVILLCIFVLFNNKILWTFSRSNMYELVASAGYCFVMIGMYFFFRYLRTQKKKELFIASIFMASSVACRPTCLIGSTIIFGKIIYDIIIKIKEKNIDKKYVIKIIICLLPYAVIGILLMIYNYIRFESIFEFGANYQLSVTDFTKFGFNINRMIIGTITYFFSPIKYCFEFPFVTSESFMPNYMGFFYSLPIGGGYFTMSIVGIIMFGIPWMWKAIKKYNKEMSWLILANLIMGIFLTVFESNKAGNAGRYMLDFLWMFNIVTILALLFIYNNIKEEKNKKIFIKIIFILILISCIINTLVIYSNEGSRLQSLNNLKIYYKIKYMLCFWK